MTRVNHIPELGYTPQATPLTPQENPGLMAIGGAAIRQENPVYNQYDFLTRERFAADPNFNLGEASQNDPVFMRAPKAFSGVKSQQEYDQVKARIAQEDSDRQLLGASGATGFVAQAVSGMLSPTMFIPFTAGGRGVRAVGEAMLLAAGGAAIDESMIARNQLLRTRGEEALSIGGSAILAGILGGAAVHIHAKAREKAVNDMVSLHGLEPISYAPEGGPTVKFNNAEEFKAYVREKAGNDPEIEATLKDIKDQDLFVRRESSIGAKANEPGDPGRLFAPNLIARKVVDALSYLNPVTRLANNVYSPRARQFMAQIDDAGLKFENDGINPHALGGTAYARNLYYQAPEAEFIRRLDDAYSRYVLGDKRPEGTLQKADLAHIRNTVARQEGKMSYDEFNDTVFTHAQTGEAHADPHINSAAKAFNQYFEEFRKAAAEAQDYRQENFDPGTRPLFDPEGNLGPDAINYVNHRFDPQKIDQDPQGFENMLADNALQQLKQDYANDLKKFVKKHAKLKQEYEYAQLDGPASREEYSRLEGQIEAAKEDPEFAAWKEQELLYQRELRQAKKDGDTLKEQEVKTQLKEHQQNRSENVRAVGDMIKEAQMGQRQLSKSIGRLEDVVQENLAKVEELEVQDLNALDTVTNAGRKLERKLQKLAGNKLDAEAKQLYAQLGDAMRKAQGAYDRITKLYKSKPMKAQAAFDAYNRAQVLSKQREKWDAQANKIIDKLEKAESFDRQQARDTLLAIQDLNNKRVRDLNYRRAVREYKLLEEVKGLEKEMTPEAVAARKEEAFRNMVEFEEAFDSKWRERGGEGGDLTRGNAEFDNAARDAAELLVEKIRGSGPNVSGLDIIGEKRGPELARVLNIPLEIKKKYLITDVEKLSRSYARTMGPDIELYRAFGSVNAGPAFESVKEDFRRIISRAQKSTQRPASNGDFQSWIRGEALPDNVKMRDWKAGEKEKVLTDFAQQQDKVLRDMEVVIKRFRHQRGIPDDPTSFAYRAGKTMSDLNVARMMGSVVVSSLPDLARPVMRYGVRKTFGGTLMHAMNDIRSVPLIRSEAKRLGIALDPILHNRMQAVFDMWDDYASRKTLAERATGFLANKTGLVAGFDRWTAEMKHLASSVTMTELSHAMQAVSEGRALQKELEYLSENGIDQNLAKKLWDQHLLPGGSTDIKGVKIPNTEAWTDESLKRAYGAALNRMVNTLIVTPSLDLPSWVDKNMATRLVAQFRSFTFSSTNKVVMSGLQKTDMALIEGMAFSLALGAVSYYVGAVAIGGDRLKEANKADWRRLTDEAIDRSGLLGIFGEGRNLAQKIPLTSEYASLSGYRTGTRRATSLVGDLFGPSVDLIENGLGVVTGIDSPTQSTVHDVRRLLPYQNVYYLRQLFSNMVEEPIASYLPERRG